MQNDHELVVLCKSCSNGDSNIVCQELLPPEVRKCKSVSSMVLHMGHEDELLCLYLASRRWVGRYSNIHCRMICWDPQESEPNTWANSFQAMLSRICWSISSRRQMCWRVDKSMKACWRSLV